MKRWYVIKTKPKKEKSVSNQLTQASFELFFPEIRGLASPKPLFPSYMFIKSDFEDPYAHRLVRFTRGVSRILGDETGPQPIEGVIVETLIERTKDCSIIEQELLFKEGDTVLVKRGILKDLAGIIEQNIPSSGRVKVLFKWLQIKMRADFKYTELEKVA